MSAILKQKLIDIANGFTKYGLWKGGGSGGSSALSEMTDVTFTNLQANDVLKYNGSFWVNNDNLHEYSTKEKIVGKWIDNKTIYERVIYVNNFIIGNNEIKLENLDTIINYSGSLIISGDKRVFPFIQNNTINKVIINDYNNTRIVVNTSFNCNNIYIIIQYTKTTE